MAEPIAAPTERKPKPKPPKVIKPGSEWMALVQRWYPPRLKAQ